MAAFLARLYKSMTGSDAPIVATPFTDVPDTSFAKDSVARIYGLGITTGTTATTYSPDDVVTREQMAAFLARLYKAAEGADAPIVATPFTDVPDTSFAKDSVARIYGLGITTGTTATTYSPADPVTREQMASFLARLFRAG
jgi:L-amino acid N-acyltransferase YncA